MSGCNREQLVKVSRALSYFLRRSPEIRATYMDENGWVLEAGTELQ